MGLVFGLTAGDGEREVIKKIGPDMRTCYLADR
jgi:hypothetical protein